LTPAPGAGAEPGRGWAAPLALLLFFGVLTLWVRQRWALSLLESGVFLTGIAWLIDWARRKAPLSGSAVLIPLLGAALWGPLQLLLGTTVYRFDTLQAALYWTAALVLAFVGFQALQADRVRAWFLRLLLYFGFAVSVLAATQYFTSGGRIFWIFPSGYPDALGPFVYRNNYAAFIELVLPVALVTAMRERRRTLTFCLMAGVMYASVIASASRAGSVLVTAEALVLLGLGARRKWISGRGAGMVMAGVLGSAAVFSSIVGWGALLERFGQQDPFAHRREMLRSALAMARARPWLGFGLGSFQEAYPAYATFDIGLVVNHAHNDWAEWLAEGGVPFLAMLAAWAVWTVRPAVRSLWGIGLLTVFLHALVDYPMQRLGLAAWVFALAGALAAEERSRRRANP